MTDEQLERKRAKDREKRKRYRENMTEEQRERERKYQREYYRRKMERKRLEEEGKPKPKTKAEIAKEEKAAKKKAQEEEKAKQKAKRIMKRKKESVSGNPFALENARARALGLTYGKYQQLKQAGRVPENIDISREIKVEQVATQEEAKAKKKKSVIELQNEQIARSIAENMEKKRIAAEARKIFDVAAERYKRITNKNKEAVTNGTRSKD